MENDVLLYPNPVKKNLELETQEAIRNVEIFNLDGHVVFNEDYRGDIKELSLNMSGLISGIYYVKVEAEKLIHTEKIVVK